MSRIILTRSRSRTPSRSRKAQIAAYHILAATARKEDEEFGHAAAEHIYQLQQRDRLSNSQKSNIVWLTIDFILLLVALGLVVSSRCAQNNCDAAATTFMALFVTSLTYFAKEIDEGESAIRVFVRILSICFITDLFKLDEVDMRRVMK